MVKKGVQVFHQRSVTIPLFRQCSVFRYSMFQRSWFYSVLFLMAFTASWTLYSTRPFSLWFQKRRAKDWWNNNIKAVRKEMTAPVRRSKLRQSPENLRKMVEVKEKYQTVISEAKTLKQYKSNKKFLNESKHSTQFWQSSWQEHK